MNKFLAILILWLAIGMNAIAESKISFDYEIKNSWADQQSLYILFKKTRSLVVWSIFNNAGTVQNKESKYYLRKYKKDEVIGHTFNVETGGVPIAESAMNAALYYYVDQDLLVQESNGITTITSGQKQAQFACDHKAWGDVLPIKSGTTVYYCGHLFSSLTGEVTKFPPNVEERILSLRKREEPRPHMQPLIYVAEGRYLLFKSGVRSSPEMLKVSIAKPDDVTSLKPFYLSDDGFLTLNELYAHSVNSFVLRHNENREVSLLCNSNECEEIIQPGIYGNFLVVDDTSGAFYFISRKNLVAPEITITNYTDKVKAVEWGLGQHRN